MQASQQKSTVDSKKIKKRESKCPSTENHWLIEEGSVTGRKEQEDYKTARGQEDGMSKPLLINN